ncbi:30S ribosomal protein S6 [Candidatus Uzinura diaspidicola str. ASNER]|uniref:Small ribosomal subunit protein bS6 n=1 Tax=Candidatus Uzinura diaspidicola str. ASNER TaxID=1133592 RepID=L7VJW5_9FLAO|nr:30S ribosomal protein S6 [Candidatus Uzinura diaspidicola str. ASNER]
MKRHYETVFILTPVLSQIKVEETVEKIQNFLKEKNAMVEYHESWGLKKLAYSINNKTTGYYELIQFQIDYTKASKNKNIISDLDLNFKRDEKVIRFLTVKLDKYALVYAKNRIQKIKSFKIDNYDR